MSQEDEKQAAREVTEVDAAILRDLQSKHADVICPVHGERPRFDIDEAGGVVESFCCDALMQIFREVGSSPTA
jgi:phage/plasmid primase-like uncharacterized protein